MRLPSDGGDELFGEVALAFNALVSENEDLVAELERVSRTVTTEGRTTERAALGSAAGSWSVALGSVNRMLDATTYPLLELTRLLQQMTSGDLSRELPTHDGGRPLSGDSFALGNAFNDLTRCLRIVSGGISQVVHEVGIEGRLGATAATSGVSGRWRGLLDEVNRFSEDLAVRLRDVASVSTSLAHGDLSQKITVEAYGEFFHLKNTINTTIDQLRWFTTEVTRVAREVGTEGRLGGQADVKGVSGTWKDLTDNVNLMARNLTDQVRGIAKVVTAVADGDLSQKFVVGAKGEIADLADTINGMTDTLRSFAEQVSTVAREVGIEGKLGGQADVEGVSGTWKDLTDNVNLMASNLTSQVRGIVKVVTAVANGDLTQKFSVAAAGEIATLADTINGMTDTLRIFAEQVITVAHEVGIEGKLGGQAKVPGVVGTWRDLTENVNMLAGNLTDQVRNIAYVTTAVANGDLSQKITVDVRGEVLELKETINSMVDQLRAFAAEVTRVAGEVGTEGRLGGQAEVPGVAGTWKDLTDNVNFMASNLTNQVRGIVKVVTAVANGDLSRTFVIEAKGEIAALADTINAMTGTLHTFAEQVTTVAREVGTEGKLGGQAKVPGAAGTWRDLTDNVNQLAGNLTTQVRAISEVATAVTKGDLTRTIDVEAQGEVLGLKDTINQMISNLRDTTKTNKEQDWLKTNLAKFSGMMQGQRSLESLTQLIMSELTPVVSAQVGTFFVMDQEQDRPTLRLLSSYGYTRRKNVSNRFQLGEGLVGQAALEKKTILVTHVPEDYLPIRSSLGEAPACNIVMLPILFEGQVKGVIELGSFEPFSPIHVTFLEQVMLSIGVVFNMISASRRTEELLEELRRSNVELGRRSKELEEKARLLEIRNHEIREASESLEEKAEQLAMVSKYKSEFLANMSHELRTPLNSILILTNLLVDNIDKNLTHEQIEYARTVYSSASDLLSLINQILDLSKIEAGRMNIETRTIRVEDVCSFIEYNFRSTASQKGVGLQITVGSDVPPTIVTDSQRLEQILKNLLSNAFKFTETGSVDVRIALERDTQRFRTPHLRRSHMALAFIIADTGIGIPPDKQQIIFEAFQQADASTSRVYGGTGLGLTISRELTRLLGGELQMRSTVGVGSTFTLYIPISPPIESRSIEADALDVATEAHPDNAEEESDDEGQAVTPDASGVVALVVDDDVRNLFAVTSLLERSGVRVLPASSANEASEILESNSDVEVVLMDMMMPEVDGYEATRRLRRDPRFEHLPIIALTAKAMPGDKEKALEAGCDDFVPKPVERKRLLSVIAERTHRGRGQ